MEWTSPQRNATAVVGDREEAACLLDASTFDAAKIVSAVVRYCSTCRPADVGREEWERKRETGGCGLPKSRRCRPGMSEYCHPDREQPKMAAFSTETQQCYWAVIAFVVGEKRLILEAATFGTARRVILVFGPATYILVLTRSCRSFLRSPRSSITDYHAYIRQSLVKLREYGSWFSWSLE